MFSLTPGTRYILISTVFFSLMNIGVKYLTRIPAYEIVFFRALVTLVVDLVVLYFAVKLFQREAILTGWK